MNKIFGALRQLFLLGVMVLSAESYAVASGGNQQSIGEKVIPAEGVFVKPKLKSDSCGEPIYPAISKRNNEEGKVGVQLWINESGNVVTVKVAVSSGFPALDEGAIAFLSRCKFEPATQNGLPIAVWYPLNHRWTLADSPDQKPVATGDYSFEDTTKSVNLTTYMREACSNYVSGFNNSETQDYEPLGVKKLTESDVCSCVEKRTKADMYLKLLAVDPAPDVTKIMDEEKFGIYLSRKMTVILMQCTAKSIDETIAKLDPLRKQ